MFFAEDCLVTDATFEDEILKIVKFIKGFVFVSKKATCGIKFLTPVKHHN